MTRAPRLVGPGVAAALLAVLIASASVSSSPQAQTPASGDRIVVGQLIDGVTGRPVGNALIVLTAGLAAVPDPGAGRGASTTTLTQRVFADDSGRFIFHSLPTGSFALGATLSGYTPAQFGQTRASGPAGRLELGTGARVTNVTMKIWKLSGIAGVVRDETGDPIGGARVQLVSVTGPASRRQYAVRSFGTTDDRGAYRFGELQAGDYLVQVPLLVNSIPVEAAVAYLDAMAARTNHVRDDVTASGGTLTTAGYQIGDQLIQSAGARGGVPSPLIVETTGRMLVYPETYHPGVRTVAGATMVALPAGEQRSGIDLALNPVPAFRVSGMVTGPGGPLPHTTVKITPEGVDGQIGTPSIGGEIAMAVTRRDGTFTAIGVPAGRYVASVVKTATPPSIDGPAPTDLRLWWAHATIVVGDADVTNVQLPLTPGVTVTGRLEFDAAVAPAQAVLQRARVFLRASAESPGARSVSAPINADGTFTSGEVRPGRYLVSVVAAPAGLVLKTLAVGGRDFTGETIDVPESGVRDVVVTFTDKAGELTGTVTKHAAAVQIVVYTLPMDPRAPAQVRPALLRRVPAGADGTYRFSAVVPGEYIVAAVADAPEIDSEDPRVIAALARVGTRVILVDREKRSLNLSLVTIK